MARGENYTAMRTKFVTASQTIGNSDVTLRGRLLVSENRAHLVLPTPSASLELEDRELKVVNATEDWMTIECPGSDFNGNKSQLVVGPYEQAMCNYARDIAGAGYQLDFMGPKVPTAVSSYTPTLAWTTATPGSSTITNTMKYSYHDGIVHFKGKVLTTDGAGATALTVTLPIVPQNLSLKIPVKATKSIDGTETNCLAYIAADQATEANRLLTIATGTWTDNKTCWVEYSGWYAVHGFTTWSPTITYATGTPACQTTVAVYKIVEDLCFALFQNTSNDSNGCTAATVTLPETVPPDTGAYISVTALQLNNATYTDPYGFIDSNHATAGSRYLSFSQFGTVADGEAVGLSVAMVYEIDGGIDYSADLNAEWTTGTPASLTTSARYRVIDGQWCWFEVYLTSADSNGCTGLEFSPPLVPLLDTTSNVRLDGYVLNNSTHVAPAAYLDTSQTTPADRTVKFDLFPTCSDGATVTVRVAGMYRVAG